MEVVDAHQHVGSLADALSWSSFTRDIGDRVVMFDRGKIVEEGTPAELFTAPREERTQTFLNAVLEH